MESISQSLQREAPSTAPSSLNITPNFDMIAEDDCFFCTADPSGTTSASISSSTRRSASQDTATRSTSTLPWPLNVMPNRSTFLSLPREIRNIIYRMAFPEVLEVTINERRWVLNSARPDLASESLAFQEPYRIPLPNVIVLNKHAFRPFTSLMRVNAQLRDEMQDELQVLLLKRIRIEVDMGHESSVDQPGARVQDKTEKDGARTLSPLPSWFGGVQRLIVNDLNRFRIYSRGPGGINARRVENLQAYCLRPIHPENWNGRKWVMGFTSKLVHQTSGPKPNPEILATLRSIHDVLQDKKKARIMDALSPGELTGVKMEAVMKIVAEVTRDQHQTALTVGALNPGHIVWPTSRREALIAYRSRMKAKKEAQQERQAQKAFADTMNVWAGAVEHKG